MSKIALLLACCLIYSPYVSAQQHAWSYTPTDVCIDDVEISIYSIAGMSVTITLYGRGIVSLKRGDHRGETVVEESAPIPKEDVVHFLEELCAIDFFSMSSEYARDCVGVTLVGDTLQFTKGRLVLDGGTTVFYCKLGSYEKRVLSAAAMGPLELLQIEQSINTYARNAIKISKEND